MDEMAAREIEGRTELPVWQDAFTLGPNVRFSRTPEAALSRNKTASESQPTAIAMAQPQTMAGPDAATVPAAPVNLAAMHGLSGSAAAVAAIPQEIHPVGARAITFRLRQEFETRHPHGSRTGFPHRVSGDFQPVPGQSGSAPLGRLIDALREGLKSEAPPEMSTAAADVHRESAGAASYLSDYAFWEAIAIASDEAPVPSAKAEPSAWRNREILRAAIQPAPAVVAAPEVTTSVVPARADAIAPTRTAVFVPPPVPRFVLEDGAVANLYREIAVDAPASLAPSVTAPAQSLLAELDAVARLVEPPVTASVSQETAPVAEAVAEQPVPAPGRLRLAMLEPVFDGSAPEDFEFPSIHLLQEPQLRVETAMTPEALEQSAGLLESVLEDFGVKGEIIDVRPGPVVTLYEFEPAPGVKSSRVIGLSDDIARSMSALSARVAVVPGRNVIGIELPNPVRETVYLRELIESADYAGSRFHLPLCLGKTIGGEPVIVELAKMPHLLVAGTTGSGKSVAINTMILSLLYRLKPEECRLIMVDPKMLELSVYDGIPHLLTPVVTDPKKAVMALKWAVREMEERYRKMSRLGVRNIDGYNSRAAAARAKGESIFCTVQNGFDKQTGELLYEQVEMDLTAMPYIVVIVDEMADLMMVAGKEIEGAIQRLAQMARAAGIHLIMATQRPSVDVITGTIKANFPTRISFQVTSKIDSRTILGEPGAEHLLGQGDMLHMVGGGRIARVHGPFVSDGEVEKVVAHLKTQGRPEYLGTVTEDADELEDETEEDTPVFDKSALAEEDGNDLYDKAVKLVLRDKKCSTSYIQRRLGIGYNRAASLVERMEQEGLVGPANHVGKRAILSGNRDAHDSSPMESFD